MKIIKAFFFYLSQYVKTNVPGPGCNRELLSEQYVGCTCEKDCEVETCSCLQNFGSAYDTNGILTESFVKQQTSKPILECGDDCSCKMNSCSNRVVQKGVTAKFGVCYFEGKGFGLKILENLQRCSFVCEYAGEIVDRAEAKKRLQVTDSSGLSNYLICLREHVFNGDICTFVDPCCVGNLGRFINHSCDPNLIMLPVRINHSIPRLALFSRKDLKVGEELTFDYSGNATFSCDQNQGLAKPEGRYQESQEDQEESAVVGKRASKMRRKRNGNTQKNFTIKNLCRSSHKLSKDKIFAMKLKRNLNISGSVSQPSSSEEYHPSKSRKPCLCQSKNCIQFLPYDSF